jgi:hypothetical protein
MDSKAPPDYWAHLAQLAPIATASIAFIAFLVAIASVLIQKNLARRRAAIDLFFKIDVESAGKEVYLQYLKGVDELEKIPPQDSLDIFERTDHGQAINKFLDINELIAVGIYHRIFDHRICYDYWSYILCECRESCARMIAQSQKKNGAHKTYEHLVLLHKSWEKDWKLWPYWRWLPQSSSEPTITRHLVRYLRSKVQRHNPARPAAEATTAPAGVGKGHGRSSRGGPGQ